MTLMYIYVIEPPTELGWQQTCLKYNSFIVLKWMTTGTESFDGKVGLLD